MKKGLAPTFGFETLFPKLAKMFENGPIAASIRSDLKPQKNVKGILNQIDSHICQQPFPFLFTQQTITNIPLENLFQGLEEILPHIFANGPIQSIQALDDFLAKTRLESFLSSLEDEILVIVQEFLEWLGLIQKQSNLRIIDPSIKPYLPDSGKVDRAIILNNIDIMIGRLFNLLKNILSGPSYYKSSFLEPSDLLGYAAISFFALLILREIKTIQNKLRGKPSYQSLWSNTFKIGIYLSIGFTLGAQGFMLQELMKCAVSAEGARHVQKKWTPLKELSKNALKIAEEKWEKEKAKGEMPWHDEMAHYVLREIKKSKPGLVEDYLKSIHSTVEKSLRRVITEAEWDKYALKAIRRAIKPVATKYGRLWNASGKRGIE
ncbi:MAG: hypothetical protein FJ123_00010 [Deltaproteobacteria bacterium]|nr:hypothetical protein [Deltaproteobacteria bacterium]